MYGNLEHMCMGSCLGVVLGPECSQGFYFDWAGGLVALDKARESGSWSWTVVPGKLVMDHCKAVEQVSSPYSQDLGSRRDSKAILILVVTTSSLQAC